LLRQEEGISHIYCTDHVLQLTANKCYKENADTQVTFGND